MDEKVYKESRGEERDKKNVLNKKYINIDIFEVILSKVCWNGNVLIMVVEILSLFSK